MYAKKKINVWKNLWWLLSCRMAQNTSWLLLASRSRLWMLYWYNSRCFWHRFFFVWLRTNNTCGSCCLKLVKTWKNLLQLLLSLNSWIVFIYHYRCKKISSFWSIVKCIYSRICTSLGCNSSLIVKLIASIQSTFHGKCILLDFLSDTCTRYMYSHHDFFLNQ